MESNKLTRASKCRRMLEHGTYFKYIKFEYKGHVVIVDMEDLQLKEFTNNYDLNKHILPNIDRQTNYNKDIGVTRIDSAKKGLFTNYRFTENNSTQQRVITINTNEGPIVFRLARDKKNILHRNSIEMKFKYSAELRKYKGLIIKRDSQNNNIVF